MVEAQPGNPGKFASSRIAWCVLSGSCDARQCTVARGTPSLARVAAKIHKVLITRTILSEWLKLAKRQGPCARVSGRLEAFRNDPRSSSAEGINTRPQTDAWRA